jgi:hypothetical protein
MDAGHISNVHQKDSLKQYHTREGIEDRLSPVMLGPGRTNLRPGLSCLLDDAGPLVPAHERLHPFCLPLKRLSKYGLP